MASKINEAKRQTVIGAQSHFAICGAHPQSNFLVAFTERARVWARINQLNQVRYDLNVVTCSPCLYENIPCERHIFVTFTTSEADVC